MDSTTYTYSAESVQAEQPVDMDQSSNGGFYCVIADPPLRSGGLCYSKIVLLLVSLVSGHSHLKSLCASTFSLSRNYRQIIRFIGPQKDSCEALIGVAARHETQAETSPEPGISTQVSAQKCRCCYITSLRELAR
ncbi:hypothetical protein BDV93DRAFT_512843 [Ceratobasidium sp. AG-I]|nr:hypothetical protein BDV93DRAFT_512843 [Ceratobasidium sp. AG-I]